MKTLVDNLWEVIAAAGVLIVAAILTVWVFAEKRVDGYYLSHGSGNGRAAICVYAHWTWHVDEIAFCSDDKDRALDFVARANAGLAQSPAAKP